MNKLAESEFNVMRLVHELFAVQQSRTGESVFYRKHTLSYEFSPVFLSLLADTISKGAVVSLVRMGWKKQCQPGQSGAYWWSSQPGQALEFSGYSIRLIGWVLESDFRVGAYSPFNEKVRTLGDELVLYLVARQLCRMNCRQAVRQSLAFRQSALCWLGYFDILSEQKALSAEDIRLADFDKLLRLNGWLFNCLKQTWFDAWFSIETAKELVADPQLMFNLGETQKRLIGHLFELAAMQRQPDQIDFIFQLAAKLVKYKPDPANWIRALPQSLSIQDRVTVSAAALALFAAIESQYPAIEAARLVRFFDEEYEYSQLLLKHWDHYGESGRQHAAKMREQLQRFYNVSDKGHSPG